MSGVIVVGSVNLDLVIAAPRIPAPGETILGSDLVQRPGGKGANQAVAARRLGADTVLVAAMGDDATGSTLHAALSGEGVDLSQVATVDRATGTALIVVDEAGENAIVVAPGANQVLDLPHLSELAGLLEQSDMLLLQLEIPLATALEAATRARDAGVTVMLNAAPLPAAPSPTLNQLLAVVDVLVLNEGEAAHLLGKPAPPDLAGWGRLAADLGKLGPRVAVVTLGAQGALAATDGQIHTQLAYEVKVVDTTGAGDSFSGALAVAIAEGRPIAEGLSRACAAGALATARLGAQEAMPTATELERFLHHAERGGADA